MTTALWDPPRNLFNVPLPVISRDRNTTVLASIYKIHTAVIYGLRDRIKRRISGGDGIGTQNGAYLILVISVAADTIKIERGQFKRGVATVKLVSTGLLDLSVRKRE